jgi:hypothetical protein
MKVAFNDLVLNVVEKHGVQVLSTLTFFHVEKHQIIIDVLLAEIKRGKINSFKLHADSIEVSAFTQKIDVIWHD